MVEADDKRNVYSLRGDADALKMLRKLTPREADTLFALPSDTDAHDEDGVLVAPAPSGAPTPEGTFRHVETSPR